MVYLLGSDFSSIEKCKEKYSKSTQEKHGKNTRTTQEQTLKKHGKTQENLRKDAGWAQEAQTNAGKTH